MKIELRRQSDTTPPALLLSDLRTRKNQKFPNELTQLQQNQQIQLANSPASAPFLPTMTAANPQTAAKSPLLAAAAFLAALLLALRLAPDALRDAALLRALLFRAAFFTLIGAVAGAAAALAIPSRPWRQTALGGAAASSILYLIALLALARAYDGRIAAASLAASNLHGTLTIHAPHRPAVSVRPTSNGGYHVTAPVSAVSLETARLLACAEDERFYTRVGGVDIEAYARAARATFKAYTTGNKSAIQGGSELAGQVGAALLPELKPHGRNLAALKTKLLKSAVAFRIDDTLTRDDQIRLYLTLAPFGSIDGHEVIGIAAAARVFYAREHSELTPAQTAELLARLKNPNIFFPYPRRGESMDKFQARLHNHRRRFNAILEIAARDGVLTTEQTRIAESEFLNGLVSYDEARRATRVPRLPQIFSELAALAPDLAQTRLDVYLQADNHLETALTGAAANIVRRIEPRLRRSGDQLQVDATVLAPDGAIVAEIGLASIPGGQASHLKPEFYALWVESGHHINERIPGLRIHGTQALAHSVNKAAEAIVRQLGLRRVVEHLRNQNHFVSGPYLSIALGAGVTGSPRTVAANFYKFGYTQPGHKVFPRWISKVIDDSGAVLFEIEPVPVFTPETAIAVRGALEKAASEGTGRNALRELAAAGLAIKTGTAGFFRRGQWLGEGGSWCVASDRPTGLTIAVRIRWESGRPFQLEGGASAAYIVRDFLAAARVSTREEMP